MAILDFFDSLCAVAPAAWYVNSSGTVRARCALGIFDTVNVMTVLLLIVFVLWSGDVEWPSLTDRGTTSLLRASFVEQLPRPPRLIPSALFSLIKDKTNRFVASASYRLEFRLWRPEELTKRKRRV